MLVGCGNAQSGAAVAAADTTIQDWETQPPLWTPHPILIPRATPPGPQIDTLVDSLRRD
jgi:hypothetical protein